jgi:dihydroneopterin aldolase
VSAPHALDTIRLEALAVDCIIGILPAERQTPQPLVVDAALELDTRPAAIGGGLGATVDYSALAKELRFLLVEGRFQLLETAADALARWALAPATPDRPHAAVERVTVRLTKPKALHGAAIPSLEIRRAAADVAYPIADGVELIHPCGIHRLHLPSPRPPMSHELALGARTILSVSYAARDA